MLSWNPHLPGRVKSSIVDRVVVTLRQIEYSALRPIVYVDDSMHYRYVAIAQLVDDYVSGFEGALLPELKNEDITSVVGWFHGSTEDHHNGAFAVCCYH